MAIKNRHAIRSRISERAPGEGRHLPIGLETAMKIGASSILYAMVTALWFVTHPVVAAELKIGDILAIGEGSWFALDADGDRRVYDGDKTWIYPGTDGGISIGSIQGVGDIDTWILLNISGAHYTTAPLAGGTETGIDFGPWSIFWNGESLLDGNYVDEGAWVPDNCETLGCTGITFLNATAAFDWSGSYGDSYSLWYSWSFNPTPSCFGCAVNYLLNLNGVVLHTAVIPLPPALWLLVSGLSLLVLGVGRGK